ncbi:MAG: hypothetical protein M1815_005675 [Lichina confinis]|nr:MAG: hypothetical protein M1815_005675 [Lichina confinis]
MYLWGWPARQLFGLLTASTARGAFGQDAAAESWQTASNAMFTVPAAATTGKPVIANVEDPEAVDAQAICPGYIASDAVDTDVGLTAQLSLAGPACNVYGNDIDHLSLTVEYQAQDRLHVEIIPTYLDSSNKSHYILPDSFVPKPTFDESAPSPAGADLQFSWTNDPTFSFTVTRRSSGDALFSTKGRKFVYEDQFIEFGSDLPPDYNVYGLGEVIRPFRLGNNLTRTLWAVDAAGPMDENLYGSHSFYLETRYTGGENAGSDGPMISASHGVYLRNAHGQDVLLRPEGITWRPIGGSIDLHFFAGPTQPEVTRSYQKAAVGFPAMQKYSALGYHQGRWGYANWSELQAVVDGFDRFEIPLEYIWSDIDIYYLYRDFTTDSNTYPYEEGREFLRRLKESGRSWVPIIDAAIYIPNPENASDAYPPFERGSKVDAFLRNPDGSLYIGDVWPGYTVFPDFLAPGARPWWIDEISRSHKELPFDGLWVDMNEASSFITGSVGRSNLTLNPVHPPFILPGEPGNIIYDYPEGFDVSNATEAAIAASLSASQVAAASTTASVTASAAPFRSSPTPGARNINHPPYQIDNVYGDLAAHAVAPNATHADGTLDYDVHNVYGHQMLNATYDALLSVLPGKRPFIISRSTFPGSGVFAGHWGGDNHSRWSYMYLSIAHALAYQLFGIPFFGVDVCGFQGNSDEQLCNRWMQLAAFFPFYRNHNIRAAFPQEPYVWASVIDASKKAMAIRYALLPYMYTLMHHAHERGDTIMRALAWEFPNDPDLAGADRQFLLGPSVLVTPVLEPGATSVRGVFPGIFEGQTWYDWYSGAPVEMPEGGSSKKISINAPLGHIPVYVRGGRILPLQQPRLTTQAVRGSPWSLLVALSAEGSATGDLYVDDGVSLDPKDTLSVIFTAEGSNTLRVKVEDWNLLMDVKINGVMT